MTDKQLTEVIEGNKLIAEFMGVMYYQSELITAELVNYHSSWDWLMPAIDKISLHQYDDKSWEGCPPYNDYAWPRTFGMISEDGKYLFRFNAQPLFEADKLIDAAWQAVVYFINQNKQP